MPILSESQVRQVTHIDKPYEMYDAGGLYLKVSTSGAKLWRFKYRFGQAERLLALGKYPDVSLKRARYKRDAARRLIADGIDPAIQKQAQKSALTNSFGEIALEWLENQRRAFAPKTFAKARWTIDDLLIPFIGKRPITALTHLEPFKRIPAAGEARKKRDRPPHAPSQRGGPPVT